MRFVCAKGHEWETNWKCINKGTWCSECSPTAMTDSKLDIIKKSILEVASKRGGKAISNYINQKHKILWECAIGHQWYATYTNVVKNNSWCPDCSSGLSERICRLALETLFNKKFPKIRPHWLRNSNGNLMELDGYCEELNLAFEHQGAQHYRITYGFIKNKQQLTALQNRDKEKKELCKMRGVHIIFIDELFNKTHPNDLKNILLLEADNLGLFVPNRNIDLNINFFYSKELELQEFLKKIQLLAIVRGGKCLETEYISCKSPMRFICEFNHIWATFSTHIQCGHWCPVCANKTPLTINDCQILAASKGGKCLSIDYINSSKHLTWQCGDCNNIWNTSYNSIQSGCWCPLCSASRRAKKRTLSIEAYRQAAIKKGGKLLSETYTSCFEKLTWQCSNGHVFESRADQVKNANKWCPQCWENSRKKKEI
jgi:hypothetical protein